MSVKILFYFFILFYKNKVSLSDEKVLPPPEVDISLGRVRGTWGVSYEGRKYAAFEGIPYALPPIGELRFEDPRPFGKWIETWQATKTYSCSQNSKLDTGTEDCLYLNVYVPTETMDHQKKFDVVVFIHGGAFMMGNGHQMAKPQFLMDRDIIFVSFNYRLGALGFLSTEDETIPGNYGLKDQVLALEWVRDNIASFGGKPESITVTGLSAGAASVHLHYFSPLSKGLFARGMSQSGTALDPWVIKRNPLERARKLGSLLGCTDESTSELKKCLKQRPAPLLLQTHNHFYGFGQMPFAPFGPVIEKNSKSAFLSTEPYSLLRESKILDVPWIVSTATDEGLYPTSWYYAHIDKIDTIWPGVAHYLLDYNQTIPKSEREDIARQIREFYLGSEEEINESSFKKFTQIFTDRLFVIGSETAAKLQSKVNESPVYYYRFNYDKGENKAAYWYSRSQQNIEGVAHGDDGIYFYGFLAFKELSERDKKVRNACQDMLYSYATTGYPSFDGTDNWQPTKYTELTYLNVSDASNIKLQTADSLVPIEFWRSIGLLEYEKYSIKD